MQFKTRTFLLFVTFISILGIPSLLGEREAFFAIISDTHVGAGSSQYTSLMHLLEREHVNLVVHTGDAINSPGNIHEWKKLHAGLGRHQRMLLAAGNHDIVDDRSLNEYLKFFSRPFYSVADEDILFVLLNTELPHQQSAIEGEQLAWLESELKRPFRHKFVFMHKPCFSVEHRSSVASRNTRETLLHALFVKAGVSLVVAGHYHTYKRSLRDGITYIVMAPGHYVDLLQLVSGAAEPGYMTATRKNNGFSFMFRNLYGRMIDEFFVAG